LFGRSHPLASFEPLDALQYRGRIRGRVGQQHSGAEQFEHQARRRGATHVGQCGVRDVGEPDQAGGTEPA
jgi:hypothetical protein